jgi:N-acetylglucosaminyl-diphospho-decaprenol L-rhamnosyltransferase
MRIREAILAATATSARRGDLPWSPMSIELSFCVVNTERRALLRYCLDAIARERATLPCEAEVIVLDNASGDGSVAVAREHPTTPEVIALSERRPDPANQTALLQRARGRMCLLLQQDAELEPGATAALHAALDADPRAGAATALLVGPDGSELPSAWSFPRAWGRLPGVERCAVQSRGAGVRRVDWARTAALLVRHTAAERVGWLDGSLAAPTDALDFCQRLRRAGLHTLYVPGARAVCHELSPGRR